MRPCRYLRTNLSLLKTKAGVDLEHAEHPRVRWKGKGMASRERDLRSAINTSVSNADPTSSSKEGESTAESETHSSGFSITPAGLKPSANEQAPGKQSEQPSQPRCIE